MALTCALNHHTLCVFQSSQEKGGDYEMGLVTPCSRIQVVMGAPQDCFSVECALYPRLSGLHMLLSISSKFIVILSVL